jgi:hypothetical protein
VDDERRGDNVIGIAEVVCFGRKRGTMRKKKRDNEGKKERC